MSVEFEVSSGVPALGEFYAMPLMARPQQENLLHLRRRGCAGAMNVSYEEVRRLYFLVVGLEEDMMVEAVMREQAREKEEVTR